ncbi:MAG: cyclic lactone autoinducer peptide [Ruminococcus sp.]|nr:cyclic lactone autoinducer peptide [Ruminococcus sp.]
MAVKKIFLKYLSCAASLAFVITAITANSTCVCIIHQDKLPVEAKKLRRF